MFHVVGVDIDLLQPDFQDEKYFTRIHVDVNESYNNFLTFILTEIRCCDLHHCPYWSL